MEKIIHTEDEMIELGRELSKTESCLLLTWRPRSGKSTLVKWFVEWLWLSPEKVTRTAINVIDNKLLHIDAMMCNNKKTKWENIKREMEKYKYIVIEHPKRLERCELKWKKIDIKWKKDEQRIITIS